MSADRDGALDSYEKCLVVHRRLAHIEPGNICRKFALGELLEKIGEVRLSDADYGGALATYEEMLAVD